jgi:hypothetical protein
MRIRSFDLFDGSPNAVSFAFEFGHWRVYLRLPAFGPQVPKMRFWKQHDAADLGMSRRDGCGSGGDMRKISPAAEIREAAVTNGTAYDPLDAPYLLVVTDCNEELPGGRHNGEALLEAVLGTVISTW